MRLKQERKDLEEALHDAFTSWEALVKLFPVGSSEERLEDFSHHFKGVPEVIDDILTWVETHDMLIVQFLLGALKQRPSNRRLLEFVTKSEQIASWHLKKDGVETELTGNELSDALLSAFPDHAELISRLSSGMGIKLDNISCYWPELLIRLELIEEMESQNCMERFIAAAHAEAHDKVKLQECSHKFQQRIKGLGAAPSTSEMKQATDLHYETRKVGLNQRRAVEAFDEMLTKDTDKSLLVIQAGDKKGKTTACNKFKMVCEFRAKQQPLSCSSIFDFQGQELIPYRLVCGLLDKLIFEFQDKLPQDSMAKLKKLRDNPYENPDEPPTQKAEASKSKRTEEGKQRALADLAKNFCSCLMKTVFPDKDRVVLIFDNFHLLRKENKECAHWFIHDFLTCARDIKKLIIVITASEHALDEVARWDSYVQHLQDIDIVQLEEEDLKDFVKQKYGYDLTFSMARTLIELANNNVNDLINIGIRYYWRGYQEGRYRLSSSESNAADSGVAQTVP